MNARAKKIILLLLAAALLAGSGQVEKSLNSDRAQLGLTIAEPLQNAPPLLAFTTVALGGFRGLISNYLWIRANNLQQDDKFFEAAQLADWITDLEPHFAQVWVFQAWNMAWNISVKFKDFPDRWRWVDRGIELLRDRGLPYNPDNTLLYQQLAWIFQSKMGQNLDDANGYYKQEWKDEMTPFFGPDGTNFTALLHPQTPEEKTNALALREKFKIDPVFAETVNEEYGPFDWRLPEANAIYWGAYGLEQARKNPAKVQADDLIQLRRIIYQSMEQLFYHGRIMVDPFTHDYSLTPDLDLTAKAYDAYQQMYDEETDPGQKSAILIPQRNFLRDAVYFLYGSNRSAEAAKWYKMLSTKFPDKPILDNDPNSFPRNLTLEDYCVRRVQEELGDTSQDRTTDVIEKLLTQSYVSLTMGDNDRYLGFRNLARQAYNHYKVKTTTPGENEARVKLSPFADLDRQVLHDLLDPKQGMPFVARAALRTQLGMPPETAAAPANTSTNAVPPFVTPTNAVQTIQTNSLSTNSAAK